MYIISNKCGDNEDQSIGIPECYLSAKNEIDLYVHVAQNIDLYVISNSMVTLKDQFRDL